MKTDKITQTSEKLIDRYRCAKVSRSYALLGGVLFIAAIARFWGIHFGLPHTACRPDETYVIGIALRFGTGDLNPHGFLYPTLYMYILFLLYACHFLLGLFMGEYASNSDFVLEYILDPTNFYLIDRFLSALLGTATVLVTFHVAKQFLDRKTAIISAFFLALAYLHVRHSHFGVVNVPVTFLIMCSVFYILKAHEDYRSRSYLLARIFAGLAASTKYIGVLLVLPMLIVHYFNISIIHNRHRKLGLLLDRRMLIFVVGLMIAFVLGSPFIIFDFPTFLSDFSYQLNTMYEHKVTGLSIGWLHHITFNLFYGLGWPLLLASLAGIPVLARANWRKGLILCSFPAIYYLLIGRGHHVLARYAVPIVPILCITAAVFTSTVVKKVEVISKHRLANLLSAVVPILIIIISVNNVIQFDRLLTKEDSRLIAQRWVYKNAANGSSIYQWGRRFFGNVQVRPTLGALKKEFELAVGRGEQGILYGVAVDHWQKQEIQGYEPWDYDAELCNFRFVDEVKTTWPDYIVVLEYAFGLPDKGPEGIQEVLKESYRLEKKFTAFDSDEQNSLYDKQDEFYVPFVGFEGVKRPGPNISVYRHNRSRSQYLHIGLPEAVIKRTQSNKRETRP